MKVMKKEYSHTLLVSGEDKVIAHQSVSYQGGKFLGAWGDANYVAAADVDIKIATMAFCRGVVCVWPHIDDSVNADTVWDIMVPKDEVWTGAAATEQIDHEIKLGDADPAPFGSPGIPNLTYLAEGDGIWGTRVYDYSEILTFAKTSDGFKDATPDTYIPNATFGISATKHVQMGDMPGVVMFAIGNPNMAATTTGHTLLQGRQWLMLRHLTRLLDEAWMQFAGLDEAGAEDPFALIALMIIELTEPQMGEETAGAWGVSSFNVWTQMHIITEVPSSNMVPSILRSG